MTPTHPPRSTCDPTAPQWRPARTSDAEHLIRIYNESVAGGGHSPTLTDGTVQEMLAILALSRQRGWPVWVMAVPDPDGTGTIPVGWAHVRPIVWAPQACRSAGDLWLYVARDWHGTGLAMRMLHRVGRESLRFGFDTITCWILDSNRRSLSLARACRLDRWALMPQVVDYGGLRFNLEIWGCRLDDPFWRAHMERLERRQHGLARLRDARRGAPQPAIVG